MSEFPSFLPEWTGEIFSLSPEQRNIMSALNELGMQVPRQPLIKLAVEVVKEDCVHIPYDRARFAH